jgi:hypothetical protein
VQATLSGTIRSQDAYVKVTEARYVMIFAATFRISINQVSRDLQDAPCASDKLGELAGKRNDLEQEQIVLNQILASKLPSSLRKKGLCQAIFLNEIPYHGKVEKEHEGD